MISDIKLEWVKYLTIYIAITLVVSILFSQYFPDFLISVLVLPGFLFVIIYLFYYTTYKFDVNTYIITIFAASLIIRIVSIIILSKILIHYVGIPFLSYKDDYIYHQSAIAITERWKSNGIGLYPDIPYSIGTYSGFPNFSALLMMIFGTSYYVPRLGNAVVSSLTCILAFRIIKGTNSIEAAKQTAIFFLFSPLLIVFSSLQLKDTLLVLLCLMSIDGSIGLLKGSGLSIIEVVFSLFMMIFIRAATIVPIIFALLIVLVYLFIKKRSFKTISYVTIIIVMIVVVSNVADFLFKVDLFGSDSGYFSTRLTSMLTRTVTEDTNAAITGTRLSKYAGPPIYLVLSLFLPSPLIVNFKNMETINYTAFALLFHFSLLPFLVSSLISAIRNRKENIYQFYIALVFIFLKIGQAFSLMSILSPRQSLPTISIMYLLLPSYNKNTPRKTFRIEVFFASLIITMGYALLRLYTHSLEG